MLFSNWNEMYPDFEERMQRKSGGNPYHDKTGKFSSHSGTPSSGTLSGGKVNIGGKQYGVGDSIDIKGKQHHVAEITNSQVIIRPGPAPKTLKSFPAAKGIPAAKTTKTKNKTTVVKDKDKQAQFPTKSGKTKGVKQTDGKFMTQEEFKKKAPTKVSAAERESMRFYDEPRGGGKGAGSQDINFSLRTSLQDMVDNGSISATDAKRVPTDIKNLKSAIGRHHAPVDMIVTRRVGIEGLGFKVNDYPDLQYGTAPKAVVSAKRKTVKDDFMNNIVGHVVQDKGFMSTSLMPDAGAMHPDITARSIANIRIGVPKGTPLLHIENKAQEILFDTNTKYAIIGAEKGADGKWILDAQILS